MSDKKRGWPSRPLQVSVFVVLLAGAAFQVFAPLRDPQARAEQLYVDAWFLGAAGRDGNRDPALAKIEAALKLSPGDPSYEQALVWLTPRERLPALLKERALGPDARTLAAGIRYQQAAQAAPGRSNQSPPDGTAADLAALDAFMAADPENALPHYLKARALARAGRTEQALSEVYAGNSLPRLGHVMPTVSDSVMNTFAFAAVTGDVFQVQARCRDVARFLSDTASLRLRQKRVDEAREILEACCRMGVHIAGAEPRMIISFLVGKAVFTMGWAGLEPLLKDFGPKDALDGYRRMGQALEVTQRQVSVFSERSDGIRRYMRLSLATGFVLLFALWSFCLLLAGLAGWLVWARAARRTGEAEPEIAAWGEGWLARVCLAAHGVAMLAVAASLIAFSTPEAGPLAVLVVCSAVALPFIPAWAALRCLRRRYREHSGTRLGAAGFLWKSPAPVRAWMHQHLSAALGYQLLFAVAILALAISLYKPLVGAHPWQFERMAVGSLSEERALVTRGVARIHEASSPQAARR